MPNAQGRDQIQRQTSGNTRPTRPPEPQSPTPAWYYIAADQRPINRASKCLLKRQNHDSRGLNPHIYLYDSDSTCDCPPTTAALTANVTTARMTECTAADTHTTVRRKLSPESICIFPKLNPLRLGDAHNNLSLTNRGKEKNRETRAINEGKLFNPSIAYKDTLVESFRIFTDPNNISNIPAQCHYTFGSTFRYRPTTAYTDRACSTLRYRPLTIYTDGACLHNGKRNASCGSGIWFTPNDARNGAFCVPGEAQSNQIVIASDSMYAINGLTDRLGTWEDNEWTGIKNAQFFKAAASILKQRLATTSFK